MYGKKYMHGLMMWANEEYFMTGNKIEANTKAAFIVINVVTTI